MECDMMVMSSKKKKVLQDFFTKRLSKKNGHLFLKMNTFKLREMRVLYKDGMLVVIKEASFQRR